MLDRSSTLLEAAPGQTGQLASRCGAKPRSLSMPSTASPLLALRLDARVRCRRARCRPRRNRLQQRRRAGRRRRRGFWHGQRSALPSNPTGPTTAVNPSATYCGQNNPLATPFPPRPYLSLSCGQCRVLLASAPISGDRGVAKGDRVFALMGRIPELYVTALVRTGVAVPATPTHRSAWAKAAAISAALKMPVKNARRAAAARSPTRPAPPHPRLKQRTRATTHATGSPKKADLVDTDP
jgi:hypothetical protein